MARTRILVVLMNGHTGDAKAASLWFSRRNLLHIHDLKVKTEVILIQNYSALRKNTLPQQYKISKAFAKTFIFDESNI